MAGGGAHGAAPALLAADDFEVPATPARGQIFAPAGGVFGEEANQFARAEERPGHAFAGEGFDIAAGIADGEHAESAEMAPAAGERAGAAVFGAIEFGGDGSAA
jgi:hypothetical protein